MIIMQYSSTNRISLCETFFKMNYNKNNKNNIIK